MTKLIEPQSDYGKIRKYLERQGFFLDRKDDVVEILLGWVSDSLSDAYNSGWQEGYESGYDAGVDDADKEVEY